jgi:hypothetical protein
MSYGEYPSVIVTCDIGLWKSNSLSTVTGSGLSFCRWGEIVSLFGRLIGRKDPKIERAGALVQVARVNATAMFVPLLDQYPALRNIDTEQWDFILTIAGVFMAMSRLEHARLPEKDKDLTSNVISHRVNAWKSDGIRCFGDCKAFFDREFDRLTAAGHEPTFVGADALGLWIVWNILGRQPKSREEVQLARTAGTMVISAFFDYWK